MYPRLCAMRRHCAPANMMTTAPDCLLLSLGHFLEPLNRVNGLLNAYLPSARFWGSNAGCVAAGNSSVTTRFPVPRALASLAAI